MSDRKFTVVQTTIVLILSYIVIAAILVFSCHNCHASISDSVSVDTLRARHRAAQRELWKLRDDEKKLMELLEKCSVALKFEPIERTK
jgi:hypothetical protein